MMGPSCGMGTTGKGWISGGIRMARSAGAVRISEMSGFFRNERSVHAGDVVPGLFDADIMDGEGLYFVMDGIWAGSGYRAQQLLNGVERRERCYVSPG